MSSSTGKRKMPWRDELEKLPTRAYFQSCKRSQDFNYPDFLLWSKNQNMSKIKVRQEWSIARKYLSASRHQSMREAATRLDIAWQSGLDAEYEKAFFLERQSQKTFEKGRRKLHDVIDEVMTKRRRRDYEGEKVFLDQELQYDEDSDDENEHLSAEPQTPAELAQDNLWDEEEDLTTGRHTPPKQMLGYDEVPLVENSEASFHHHDYTSGFTLSDEDQALYNEAAAWFKSMIGRDTESSIRKLQNTRFREPWVHGLLYDRLKLLRTGLDPACDENTYTSFWITPDFVALQTSHEVTIYTAGIKVGNEYNVSKVFQGKYHFSKDVYLANLLLHLKFCLTTK
ncbi:hypothetical protein BGZ47_010996, partial [Haplosporangium gracile]